MNAIEIAKNILEKKRVATEEEQKGRALNERLYKTKNRKVTIDGKKYTIKEIREQMNDENECVSGGYIIKLGNKKYGVDYYYNTDAWFIPDDIAPDGIHVFTSDGFFIKSISF